MIQLPSPPWKPFRGLAVTCSSWRRTVDLAALQATQRLCPVEPLLSRPHLAHWALISGCHGEALAVLREALGGSAPLGCAGARQALQGLGDPVAARVLGTTGPSELLPLQRRLLRRLAFDAGATRGGVALAQKAVAKSRSREALLDVAELLNLRATRRASWAI